MAKDKTFELMTKMYSEFSEKFETIEKGQTNLENNMQSLNVKVDSLADRLEMHDRNNKQDYKELDKKINSISKVVAKTMENVTGIEMKLEKQDIEITVIKGGKALNG